MGNLVFQATLGGQVNLVGPNTASTFNLNVPATSSTIATLTGTETFTNKTLTSPTLTTPVLGTPSSGTLTNCTGLPNAGLTNSSITIGGTAIALGASSSTITNDLSISGLTVGKGGGAVSTNTAVGASALNANTTGNANSAFGSSALVTNIIGTDNTAVGTNALNKNTGSYNTGTGVSSLYANTSGQFNTAYGWNSVPANTTGSNNVGVGAYSLNANTTASNNTAVGYQAGYSANGASLLTAIGYQAGYSCVNGDYNTFFGYKAGYASTLSSANNQYNTFIGANSGNAVTSGTKNSIIGSYTGNQGSLDIRTASNYIVLSDGDGNPRGIFDNSGAFLLNATAKVSTTTYLSVQGSTNTSNMSEWKDTTSVYATNNYYQVYFNSSNGVAGGIAHNAAGTVAFNTSSDVRLKENIVDAPSVLQKILDTKVRSYVWKEDKHQVQYGFIAQELYQQLPEAVGKGDDADEITDPKGTWQVEYGRLTPMLVKAIQELKAIVDAQAAEIAELKAKVGI